MNEHYCYSDIQEMKDKFKETSRRLEGFIDEFISIGLSISGFEGLDFCDSIDVKVRDIELSKSKIPKESGIFVITILENKKRDQHSEIIKKISELDGLKHIEEL